ncbi:unnamed protein product, partial [marine sediment metagenome]
PFVALAALDSKMITKEKCLIPNPGKNTTYKDARKFVFCFFCQNE